MQAPAGSVPSEARRDSGNGRSHLSRVRHQVCANKVPLASLTFLLLVILGPLLAPGSPLKSSADILVSPSAKHLMGTDTLGRDVLSRVFAGGQLLVLMSLAAGTGAVLIGATVGLISGYRGGPIDSVLMRSVDVLLSLPAMLVILVFAAMLPRNNLVLVMLVALLLSPAAARIIRGLTQQVASLDFVSAAEAAGERTVTLLVREILPNVRGRLAVELALRTAFAMLVISTLNFLGVGISPPAPDWGYMVNEQRVALTIAPWATLFPAFCILCAIVSINLVANWLERRWA
jgi:peptide/nickel transport system permease protein